MGKITLVLGGARSGKSTFAVDTAIKNYKKTGYIATAPYSDDNMRERIELHQRTRPQEWPTYEETKNLSELVPKIHQNHDLLLIDCLTLYVSNYFLDNKEEDFIKEKVILLLKALKDFSGDTIIVSNEVGLSVHPENNMACKFRDIAGRINQVVAKDSDEVYFLIAGIPTKIKG